MRIVLKNTLQTWSEISSWAFGLPYINIQSVKGSQEDVISYIIKIDIRIVNLNEISYIPTTIVFKLPHQIVFLVFVFDWITKHS